MDECGGDQNTGSEVLRVENDAVGTSAAGMAGDQRKPAGCGDRTSAITSGSVPTAANRS